MCLEAGNHERRLTQPRQNFFEAFSLTLTLAEAPSTRRPGGTTVVCVAASDASEGEVDLVALVGASFEDHSIGRGPSSVAGLFVPSPAACSPSGLVHSGIFGLLFEAIMSIAVSEILGSSELMIQMQIENPGSASLGLTYTLSGSAERLTRDIARAEGRVIGPASEIVSCATATFLLISAT